MATQGRASRLRKKEPAPYCCRYAEKRMRMSEIIEDFDRAIEEKDLARAKHAFEHIQTLACNGVGCEISDYGKKISHSKDCRVSRLNSLEKAVRERRTEDT